MNLEELRARKGFICDMDGVIYLGNQLLPGVREFVNWLNENGKQFLFLTNSSERSPKELRQKLQRMGLDPDAVQQQMLREAMQTFDRHMAQGGYYEGLLSGGNLASMRMNTLENNQLEESIRQAIREELAGVSISGSGESVSKKEEIPSQMLDFLSGLEDAF